MADRARDNMLEEATRWHLRLASAEEDEWLAFTEWLEADPRHNRAYEAVLAEEAEWEPLLEEAQFPQAEDEVDVAADPRFVEPELPSRSWPLSWRPAALATGIAAAAACVMAVWMMPGAQPYAIETDAGETRTVTLADGGKVILNGETRLLLDRDNPRRAELASGEARFAIVHNPSDPFTVRVGERTLVDVGTVFNVLHETDRLEVGVSEGAVRYDGPGSSVTLKPGDVLEVRGERAIVSRQPGETIGSWADGALVFEGSRLSDVAADLSRSTGVSIMTDPAIANRRFTGVIQTRGTRNDVIRQLESVLGVKVEEQEGSWMLRP